MILSPRLLRWAFLVASTYLPADRSILLAVLAKTADAPTAGAPVVSSLPVFLGVILSLLAGIVAAALYFLGVFSPGSKTRAGPGVLILGQCNAGKTALFFLLRDQLEKLPLVSSLKVLRDTVSLQLPTSGQPAGSPQADSVTVQLMDCPGHPRMRSHGYNLLREATCILYVVDGSDRAALKDAAEHLYDLFTHKALRGGAHTKCAGGGGCGSMLLCINKLDKMTRGEKMVVDELEREIERMRLSRSIALEGQDAADSYLGVEGEKFKLSQHAPLAVTVCTISVTHNRISLIYDFLRLRLL